MVKDDEHAATSLRPQQFSVVHFVWSWMLGAKFAIWNLYNALPAFNSSFISLWMLAGKALASKTS
jgi:hypothetical protein